MMSRIGTGLFVTGAFATVLGAIATAGNVVAPDFNGWRVVFHAGVLVLFLAGATIVVEPTTAGEVLIATAVGVVGQAVVSVVLVVVSGENATIAHTLSWQVLSLLPMSVGYILGGLHYVNERFDRRSYYIWVLSTLSILSGLLTWIGSYVLFVLTHDTTGELSYHPRFLLIAYAFVLAADVIGAIFLLALWRVSEYLGTENNASSAHHS